MSSLNTIAYAIAEQTNDDLKWQHLRAAYLLALRNSNGWIRAQTIDCALRLPPSLIENDLEVYTLYHYIFFCNICICSLSLINFTPR